MFVVNGMFPGKLGFSAYVDRSKADISLGPLIEVNEGDTIIVHVNNQLSMGQAIRELFQPRVDPWES